MKLRFLGTRGYINTKSRRHRMHSSLIISYKGCEIMIDCGESWLGKMKDLKPHAIIVTHGHPDHAWGLKQDIRCPVYATKDTWQDIEDFEISDRLTIKHREPFKIKEITIEAYPVEHSTRCPAVGYRIKAGQVIIFYVPDVVYIHNREEALSDAKLYVGDGATITRPIVRKRGDSLIGHVPISTQLTWCEKENVPEAVFTHCGSQIVKGDERTIRAEINNMGRERGVKTRIAYDGLEMILR